MSPRAGLFFGVVVALAFGACIENSKGASCQLGEKRYEIQLLRGEVNKTVALPSDLVQTGEKAAICATLDSANEIDYMLIAAKAYMRAAQGYQAAGDESSAEFAKGQATLFARTLLHEKRANAGVRYEARRILAVLEGPV